MTALALTDRDTLAGSVRFAKAAAAAGVRPVFGVDVAVAPLIAPGPAAGRPRTPARGGAHVLEPPLRVTLLAQNLAGWARLCRLVSAAYGEAGDGLPVVSWVTLRAYADEVLVVILGPSAEPMRALSAGRPDIAELRLAARTVGLGDQLGVRTCCPVRFATPILTSTGWLMSSTLRGFSGPSIAGAWTAASAG